MSPPDEQDKTLAVEDLAISYGRQTIIGGLDLSLTPGMFTALIGPNGSGKSTLLKALAGLLAPRQGHVFLNGLSIAEYSPKPLARRIGVLSQGPVAPEGLTVVELVRQGRYPYRSLLGRWSQQDEDACADALELTAMTKLRDRALDSLSGGQRQRAWIAMTLAQETNILLLDEPTTFLDLAYQIELMELIVRLVRERGKTVVAILHDLNQAARYADRMVLLKSGELVASGAPEAVMTSAIIEQVFGVRSVVIADPVSGKPMCIPVGRSGSG